MNAQEMSQSQRTELLQQEITKYVRKGFHVVSQTETTAQLVKPKNFSLLWALLWFLLFGIGLIIYLIWYWSRRDQTVYLEVSPMGKITRR